MKRYRRRYLLFCLHHDQGHVTERQLSDAIWRSHLSLYGEINAADSKLYLLTFDDTTGVGVLQCTEAALQQVITASVVINEIGNMFVSFEPKRVSGTIKGLKQQIPRRKERPQ